MLSTVNIKCTKRFFSLLSPKECKVGGKKILHGNPGYSATTTNSFEKFKGYG